MGCSGSQGLSVHISLQEVFGDSEPTDRADKRKGVELWSRSLFVLFFKAYIYFFIFLLQAPVRLAGHITALGPERRPPCCSAPGCPVSPGRSRSITRTEGGARESRGERGRRVVRHKGRWREGNCDSVEIMGRQSSDWTAGTHLLCTHTRTCARTHPPARHKKRFCWKLFLKENHVDHSSKKNKTKKTNITFSFTCALSSFIFPFFLRSYSSQLPCLHAR